MEEIISLEEFEFIHRPRVKNNTAKKELITFNIITELQAITGKPNKNIYDLAMLFIFKYIMTAVKKDPLHGDYSDDATVKMMKKAGELLNEYGGFDTMHRVLLFWVPPRYRAEINCIWDDIGDWKA